MDVSFILNQTKLAGIFALYFIIIINYLMKSIFTAKPAISTGNLRCANQSSENPTTTPSRTIGLLTP